MQGTLHESVQQLIDATLNPGNEYARTRPGRPVRAVEVVGEVVGKHQQRFDDRNHQHRDDDGRQRLPRLSYTSGNEEEGGECGDRGQHREDQGHLDSPRPTDRRDHARRALHSFEVDVLGDDNRIVHHDPDGEDEREEGDRVDRHVECEHHGKGADPRNPEADGHPEREPQFQEQPQGDQHQQQPEKAVLNENGGALLEGIGFVVPDGDAHAVRERGSDLVGDVRPNGARHTHHLLTVGPRYLDEDRRQTLVPDDQIRGLEPVAHFGDIAQTNDRAVAAAQDDDLLEVLLVVALSQGAHPDLRLLRVDAAGRQIQGTAANRIGNIAQRQSERSQPLQRHFDRDLVVPHAAGLDLGDGGQRGEFVLDAVCKLLQRTLADVAIHDQAHHALRVGHLPDLGPLGFAREGLNAADRRLDIGQRIVHVGARTHLHPDRPHPRGRHRLDRLHVAQPLDLVLDLRDDALLHLLGGCARIGDGDLDLVEGHGGPCFQLELEERRDTRDENADHQQVGGDAVARHVGDRAARFAVVSWAGSHGPASAFL